MTINEKKMNVKGILLSDYEMNTLRDAKGTLNLIFSRLTAKNNITRVAHILQDLEDLIDELEENGNSILEFTEEV